MVKHPPVPIRRPHRWRGRLAALGLSLLVAAVLLELSVRTYDKLTGQGFLSGQRNPLAASPRKRRPFRQFGAELYVTEGSSTWLSSNHGERFPLEKADGSFRIVVFGGSTTFNKHAWEAQGIHYPGVLQELLRERTGRDDIEVISTAFPAYSTAHSLVLFELDVLSWDPDLVILSHNVNDLSAAYWPHFVPDYSHKYSHPVYMGGERADDWTTLNVLFQHSQGYWFLKQALGRALSGSSTRTTGIRRESLGDLPDPRASASFERNLRSFVALARARDIDVALGTQPRHSSRGRFSDHMADKAYKDIVVYPLHDESLLHHAHYNDILRRVASETDAWLVDNTPLLNDVDAFFVDHVHYTPEGVRALAANYADVLQERFEQTPVAPAPWGDAILHDGPYALVLGTAQDGGHPQIGCRLACCTRGDRHLVASLLLVDPDVGGRWLLDATPDLPEQVTRMQGHPPERVRPGQRPALVDGVLLTHAHMGHYTGLAQLGREAYGARELPLLASAEMIDFLSTNGPWSQLISQGHLAPRVLEPARPEQLPTPRGVGATSLRVAAFAVPHRHEFSDTHAYLIQGPRQALLYVPDIDKWERWDQSLDELLGRVDVALVDGTFYADGEIPDRSMADIPHPFIVETIARLAGLPAELRAKVHFIHLNHTNPALDPNGAAAAAITAAGMSVAHEGQVFPL